MFLDVYPSDVTGTHSYHGQGLTQQGFCEFQEPVQHAAVPWQHRDIDPWCFKWSAKKKGWIMGIPILDPKRMSEYKKGRGNQRPLRPHLVRSLVPRMVL